MLNFGLDKNTNANAGQLHYQLGLGGAWFNSDIEGTVMIRPVLRADLQDSWVGIEDAVVPQTLCISPNPVSNGTLRVHVDAVSQWFLFDATGRQLLTGEWTTLGDHNLDLLGLNSGTYILATAEGKYARFIVE